MPELSSASLPPSTFTVDASGDTTVVVRILTTLDARNVTQFNALCRHEVQTGARNFILDFSHTTFLDSTGLGSLFALFRQVAPLNGHVVLAEVSPPVQRVLQSTRAYKVFRQFPSIQAAQEALC